MPRHVLVAYGTRSGSTAEIARFVARTLRDEGLDADALPVSETTDIGRYDAVVIGGALYTGRWPREVRHFAWRNRKTLRERAVWAFSSGPLDTSASERDIPPVPSARRAMRWTRARDHATFGGRLDAKAQGHMAKLMLDDDRGGDFRDLDDIAEWATGVAAEVRELPERL
ncbi:flavodoxin domain-containing protein [Streptomyces sp. NPDC006288]|uniref:flavodoxin domain-containing protein n=1 Tax=Streptomyces sp. NPDC006288 TaxID=3156743 RepID=UPI0033B3E7D4